MRDYLLCLLYKKVRSFLLKIFLTEQTDLNLYEYQLHDQFGQALVYIYIFLQQPAPQPFVGGNVLGLCQAIMGWAGLGPVQAFF